MAQLVVRKLEENVKLRLQARARRHRRSLEAEVRDILRAAASAKEPPAAGLGSDIARLFRGRGLPEHIPEWRGYNVDPPKIDE